MNNVLIKTTFKNSLILFKPFYKFYKDVWNPKKIVFIIGYSNNIFTEIDLIEKIEDMLNMKFKINSIDVNINNAYNIKMLDSDENISILLYNTEEHYSAGVWSNLRNNLYSLINNFKNYDTFDYYLNTDNDDFFYIKDVKHYLKNYNEVNDDYFHSVEFLSHDNFDLSQNFNFISGSYYYRLKGLKNEVNRKTSHGWCRKLNLNDKIKNEWHVGLTHNCKKFDSNFDNFKNIDYNMLCFCFGCLDLNFFLNDKHWIQCQKITEQYEYSISQKKILFNNYYKLTDEEKKNNIILECNFLKKYFI